MVWRPCRSFKLLELVGACALYMLCRSVLPPPLLVSTLARIIIVAGATTKTGSTISGTEAGVDIAQLADANRHGVETNSSPAMTIVAQEMDALRNKGRMAADRELHRHLSNFTSPSRGSVNQTNREFVYEPDQATLAMVSSTLRKSCGNKIEQVQGVSVRRVAVAFRGGSFRVGFSDQVRACDGASYEMQKAIAGSIQHAVLEPLEAAGLIVDTFVQTLPCPTKQNQFYTQASNFVCVFFPHCPIQAAHILICIRTFQSTCIWSRSMYRTCVTGSMRRNATWWEPLPSRLLGPHICR
jgi:hypothetical protein